MNTAFISYSRKDKEFVQQLAQAFKREERDIWVDWEGIPLSADWWKEIEAGIDTAANFVFILSPDSVESKVCLQEIEHALKMNKRLLPIVWRDDFDASKVHPKIASLNWIFFNGKSKFEDSFQMLLQTIDTDLEHINQHTRLLNRALEWEHSGRDNAFLLHGSDLEQADLWLSCNMQAEPPPTVLHSQYLMASRQALDKRRKIALITVITGMVITVVLAIHAHTLRLEADRQRNLAVKNHIRSLNSLSEARLVTNEQLESLMAVISAAGHFRNPDWNDSELQTITRQNLREIFYTINERNRLEGHTASVQALDISPDNTLLASVGGSDRAVRLWRKDGSGVLPQPLKLDSNGRDVAFSPNSRYFAVADANGKVTLWDKSGHLLRSIEHGKELKTVLFGPEGEYLLSGGKDRKIKQWDLNGQLLRTFEGHGSAVEDLALHPNGKILTSAGADNTVRLWDMQSGNMLNVLKGHSDRVYTVDFAPGGDMLASGSADNTIKLWQIKDPRKVTLRYTLQAHVNWVRAVRFSPNGKLLASASSDKTVKLWSRDGTLLKSLRGHQAGVRDIRFNQEGTIIVSASVDKTIKVRSLEGNFIEVLQGHSSSLKNISFSPDNTLLASVGTDRSLKLWHEDGTLLKSIPHNAGLRGVDFSPDSQYFATASYARNIQLWDREGNLLKEWPAHTSTVKNVDFNPVDGKSLVSSGSDKKIKLWTRQGDLIIELEGHEDAVNDVSFSPDGQLIVSAGADNLIKLWKTDGTLLKTLKGHDDWVNSVRFSPDGRQIISASSDKTARLWSIEGEQLKIMPHDDWVWQAAFSPDGKLIATGGSDAHVHIWDRNGNKLTALKEHTDWIRAVDFSPDGKKLASAGADKIIVLWSLDSIIQLQSNEENESLEKLLAQSCAWIEDYLRTNINLTPKQRAICGDGQHAYSIKQR